MAISALTNIRGKLENAISSCPVATAGDGEEKEMMTWHFLPVQPSPLEETNKFTRIRCSTTFYPQNPNSPYTLMAKLTV